MSLVSLLAVSTVVREHLVALLSRLDCGDAHAQASVMSLLAILRRRLAGEEIAETLSIVGADMNPAVVTSCRDLEPVIGAGEKELLVVSG